MTFKSIVNILDESKKEFLSLPDPNSVEAFYQLPRSKDTGLDKYTL
jgi:hypothetical protein